MLIAGISLNLESVEVQAAVVSALGAITTALITSVTAAIVGRLFLKHRRLKEKLQIATTDIAFLLQVEHLHCSMHVARGDRSHKLSVRSRAREAGLEWSGRFTPGRTSQQKFADRLAEITPRLPGG